MSSLTPLRSSGKKSRNEFGETCKCTEKKRRKSSNGVSKTLIHKKRICYNKDYLIMVCKNTKTYWGYIQTNNNIPQVSKCGTLKEVVFDLHIKSN